MLKKTLLFLVMAAVSVSWTGVSPAETPSKQGKGPMSYDADQIRPNSNKGAGQTKSKQTSGKVSKKKVVSGGSRSLDDVGSFRTLGEAQEAQGVYDQMQSVNNNMPRRGGSGAGLLYK